MRTSVEKVHAALDQLADADLSAAGVSMMAAASLRAVLPMVRASLIPDDPDQLDEMLAGCAQFCLTLRSDHAPPLITELIPTVPPTALEASDAEAPAVES